MLQLIKSFLLLVLGNNYGMAGFMGEGAGGDSGGSGGADGGHSDGDAGSSDNGDGRSYSYPDGLEEGLQGNKSLLKFADDKGQFNVANLMKSYVHMEGLLGKDKIQIPDETFTEDQWGQVFDKLGRPSLDKYDVKNNLAQGLQEDKAFVENFKKTAHEAGLLPKQAQKVLDYFNSSVGEKYTATVESQKQSLEEARNVLRQEYGQAYESKLKLANHAIDQFASPEELEMLQKSGILDNPVLAKLFVKIGEGLKEDTFNDEAKRSSGMSPDEIQTKIESFYSKEHAFMNKSHPNHEHAVNQMLKMQKMLLNK